MTCTLRHGGSLPPCINAARKGDVRLTVDKVLWRGPRPAGAVYVVSHWWGERHPGVEFRAAPSMEEERSTTAIFPVVTSLPNLLAYLKDMGDGFELDVRQEGNGALLGTCHLDLSALQPDRPVEGLFDAMSDAGELVAQIRLRVALCCTNAEDAGATAPLKAKVLAGAGSPATAPTPPPFPLPGAGVATPSVALSPAVSRPVGAAAPSAMAQILEKGRRLRQEMARALEANAVPDVRPVPQPGRPHPFPF
eukprot:EG_transcript_25956